ncbi:hypothetical protein LCGC14_0798700 [marine sediment metagenome]|uniref:Uncharacterized protein n=1 Tax=marine sediment metagenome TaxID=412755 RepID=A0A0F9QA66_9ZZZZ
MTLLDLSDGETFVDELPHNFETGDPCPKCGSDKTLCDLIEKAARAKLDELESMRDTLAQDAMRAHDHAADCDRRARASHDEAGALRQSLAVALSSTSARDVLLSTALDWRHCGGECKRTLCDVCKRLQVAISDVLGDES